MTTVERSLIRASSMSSPRLSVRRELTPPSISSSISESTLFHIHDRLNQLDSKVLDLRNSVLTKDAYVDRRNREDEFIRREFETHRQIAGRIDSNVLRQKTDLSQLKLDISQLKSEIGQLKSNVGLLGTGSQFLQNDIDRLRRDVNQLQVEIQQIQVDVRGTRTDLSQIQAVVSQLRTDFMILQRETNKHFGDVSSRFSLMESRMKHMERVRFNSLAHTIHAPITPVPYLEDDGTVKWPEYFPRTVWRFWCLKKKNRGE
jgi:chromosome segregation ATPase